MKIEDFGKLSDGRVAKLFILENSNGTVVKVTNFGVNIVSILLKNQERNDVDIVLGYDHLEGYLDNHPMFGATVGRNVNRISDATFTINEKTYQLVKNRGKHNIHSDKEHGFHKVLWDYEIIDDAAVKFHYLSLDGECGFPGDFNISIMYTLTKADGLVVSYHGTTNKKTIGNITNHCYFNFAGHDGGSILDTKVRILADAFTPVDEETIPTGEIRSVIGTAMDFTRMKTIGKDIDKDDEQIKMAKGYDHNFVIRQQHAGIRKMAEVFDETFGFGMELYSDLPGMQFYTGNTMNEPNGKDGVSYQPYQGFCMEPQFYPNSINMKNFESPILDVNEEYNTTTFYQFTHREVLR